jgi:PhzF family phenazine biosynthesis protein
MWHDPSMALDYFIVDAFTDKRFNGNPAAVVLDADGLSDGEMQAVAREFNLSETAFVSAAPNPDTAIGLRWFTPAVEVDMCGHATLAAVHALIHSGRFSGLPEDRGTILPIFTRTCTLTVRCEDMPAKGPDDFLIWLDLPDPELRKHPISPSMWAELLGIPQDVFDSGLPAMRTRDDDVMIFLSSLPALMEASPNFPELAKLCTQHRIRGVLIATTSTLAASTHVQSRFFAPAVGINEDPVTGSVHGPLAVYLVSAGQVPTLENHALLNCIQAEGGGRSGLVRAVVKRSPDQGYRVRIGGQCTTVMSGQLFV